MLNHRGRERGGLLRCHSGENLIQFDSIDIDSIVTRVTITTIFIQLFPGILVINKISVLLVLKSDQSLL